MRAAVHSNTQRFANDQSLETMSVTTFGMPQPSSSNWQHPNMFDSMNRQTADYGIVQQGDNSLTNKGYLFDLAPDIDQSCHSKQKTDLKTPAFSNHSTGLDRFEGYNIQHQYRSSPDGH